MNNVCMSVCVLNFLCRVTSAKNRDPPVTFLFSGTGVLQMEVSKNWRDTGLKG